MSVEHYENFPVASILLPKRLRRPVEVIYHFSRQADDIADEGDADDETRLSGLHAFRCELDRIAQGQAPQAGLFRDLAEIIQRHNLPMQPFYDLLDAFSQDVVKKRYTDFGELMEYCRRSANPVGTLLLYLYDEATPQNLAYSDAICSSLQLINFWQDAAKDYAIGRIYLPQADLTQFGVGEELIAAGHTNQAWCDLMHFECERARQMMLSGAPLGSILRGRIGLEMRLIIAGGLRILDKLESVRYDVFRQRPVLRPMDWGIMLAKSAPFRF